MQLSLKRIIVPNLPTSVLMILSVTGLWVLSMVQDGVFSNTPVPGEIPGLSALWINVLVFMITAFNALILSHFLNRFTVIRDNSFLPVFIFMILMAVWKRGHISIYPHISLSLLILAMYNFLKMYKNPKAAESAFLGSLMVSAGTLMNHMLLSIFPFIWFGFGILKAFSSRTLLASVLGIFTPWLLYASVLYMINPAIDWSGLIQFNFDPRFILSGIPLPEMIYNTVIIMLLILVFPGIFRQMSKDAIQTRNYLYFIMLILLALLTIVFVFANVQTVFLPALAFLSAILFCHPIILNKSPYFSIILLIFLATNLIYVIYLSV